MKRDTTGAGFRPALVLLGLMVLAGCSTMPTAPIVPAPGSNDAAVSNGSDPELLGGVIGGIVGGVGSIVPPVIEPIRTVTDTIIRSLPLEGGLGGALENGNIRITVPAGAVQGDVEVKIIVPDSTKLHCFLEITPATANGFDVPVLLSINAAGQPHFERLGIAWFNPATKEWEPIDSQADVTTGRVEALLPHFSEYRVQEVFRSKAGW